MVICPGFPGHLPADPQPQLTPDTHKWTIFLTSAATPPPEPKSSTDAPPVEIDKDYIPGGEDDMSYLIKRVVFRLHDTYPTPNRSEYQISLVGCREIAE